METEQKCLDREAEMIRLYFKENQSPYDIAKKLNIRKKGNNHVDDYAVLFVIEQVQEEINRGEFNPKTDIKECE